jgi:hypothetical protein
MLLEASRMWGPGQLAGACRSVAASSCERMWGGCCLGAGAPLGPASRRKGDRDLLMVCCHA